MYIKIYIYIFIYMSYINSDKRTFIVPELDRKNNKNWNKNNFSNQLQILKNQQKKNTKIKFNPYNKYQENRSLSVKPQNKNIDYHYVHIDSSEREKRPRIDSEKNITLGNNPLIISNINNEVFVKNYNNTFQSGDKITVTGLLPNLKILSTISKNINVINNPNDPDTNYLLEFIQDSYYIKVNYKHNLSPRYLSDNSNNVFVEIIGFRGNDNNEQLFYENIAIDIVNKKHVLYLVKRKEELNNDKILEQYNSNYFYIELSEKYTGPTKNIELNYNIKLKFYYYGGIPMNYLNAKYPISVNNVNGFHLVTKSEEHGFYFKPLIEPSFVMEDNYSMNSIDDILNFNAINMINEIEVGGENVKISRISKLYGCFVKPNTYTLSLKETFVNVYSIRMVGCLFPRTTYIIKNSNSNEQNNKIYWKNYNDSLQNDLLYQAEVPQGDYDINTLTNLLQYEMNKVSRNISLNQTSYDDSHNFILNCFESSNTITFESFKKAKLKNPFIGIDPDPNLNKEGTYIINIRLENHKLNKNLVKLYNSDSEVNSIRITGSLSYNGIDSTIINGIHNIHEIIDKDTFSIKLENINLNENIIDNNGGNNVKIYVKDIFRLHFDQEDTIGEVLGFRDIGLETSITYYDTIISNNDLYDSESSIDEFGNEKVIESNNFRLITDDYLIMTLENCNLIHNTGKIKKFFNQILLGSDGYYDSCITSLIPLESPLKKLSEIKVSFFTKEGNLYNFKNLDHSFLLEISTIKNKPMGTTKDINTGIVT